MARFGLALDASVDLLAVFSEENHLSHKLSRFFILHVLFLFVSGIFIAVLVINWKLTYFLWILRHCLRSGRQTKCTCGSSLAGLSDVGSSFCQGIDPWSLSMLKSRALQYIFDVLCIRADRPWQIRAMRDLVAARSSSTTVNSQGQ